MKKSLFFIVIAAAVFISCEKDTNPETLIIQGTVMQSAASMPELKNPLPDVSVYLVNLEASRDTVSSWYLPQDLIDSTSTDEAGEYIFTNVPVGNYLVMPRDTSQVCQFSWSDSPDSIWITKDSKQSEFEINFTTPEPLWFNAGYTLKCMIQFGNDFPTETQGILTDILKVQPSIAIYRRARTWDFIGWGSSWGVPYPKFGWGDWYWRGYRGNEFRYYFGNKASWTEDFTIDVSNSVYQFKDQFLVKVHYEYYEENPVIHEWIKVDTKKMGTSGTMHFSEDSPFRTLNITFNKENASIR